MGGYDDLEGRPSNRYSTMLGAARRRIVLLIFLAFFLVLTLVAFRRQDTIKEVVNSRLHPTSTEEPATKPDVTAHPKPDVKSEAKPSTIPDSKPDNKQDNKEDNKGDQKTETKPDTKTDTKSDMKLGKPSIFRGKSGSKNLKLGNGDRTLADSTVADIHNTTLGVCCIQRDGQKHFTNSLSTVRKDLRYQRTIQKRQA